MPEHADEPHVYICDILIFDSGHCEFVMPRKGGGVGGVMMSDPKLRSKL